SRKRANCPAAWVSKARPRRPHPRRKSNASKCRVSRDPPFQWHPSARCHQGPGSPGAVRSRLPRVVDFLASPDRCGRGGGIHVGGPGEAEGKLADDVDGFLRKLLYALSGDRPEGVNGLVRPAGTAELLDGLPDPKPLPKWLPEDCLAYYVRSFEESGLTGPINR